MACIVAIGAIGYFALTSTPVIKNSGTVASSPDSMAPSSCNAVSSTVPSSLLPKESLTTTKAFAPDANMLLKGKTFLSGGVNEQGTSTQLNKNPWTSLQPQVPVPVTGVGMWGLSSYLTPEDYQKAISSCPVPITDVGYKAVDSTGQSAYQLPGVKSGTL